MKLTKIKYILLLLLLPWASCSDFVEGDTNVSPNSATDAPLNSLITASQVYLFGVYTSEDARLANMWTQQFTGSERQYSSYYNYLVTSEVFDFFNSYVGVIQPTLDAESRAEVQGNTVAVGMLKVIRAMAFGRLTSLYGDIPFNEANSYPEIENPVYDDQVTIVYPGIQAMLTEAIGNLTSGEGGIPGSADLIFGGNIASWVAAAHSLKARYFLQTGDYAQAITEANLGISSSGGDMNASFGTTVSANQNPYYDFTVIQRNGYMTGANSYLRKMLTSSEPEYRGNAKTDETERLNFIFNGLDLNNNGMFTADAPMSLISYKENQLILAESNLKISSPNANAALTALNNVRAELAIEFSSGTYSAYTLADFGPGGIANSAGEGTNVALLNEIIEEKYTSLVGQIEVFIDFIRLDNPLGLTPASGTQFPKRFLYPTDEVNSNSNVPNPLPGLFDATKVNN